MLRRKKLRPIDAFPELKKKRKAKSERQVSVAFTVEGGYRIQEDDRGRKQVVFDEMQHPLPKLRMTGGQSWKPEVKRYIEWKKHVRQSFLQSLEESYQSMLPACKARVDLGEKPIPSFFGKAQMTVVASYRNDKHPDTENVFGSIADALFDNDTNLEGKFGFTVDRDCKPGVAIVLFLPDIF